MTDFDIPEGPDILKSSGKLPYSKQELDNTRVEDTLWSHAHYGGYGTNMFLTGGTKHGPLSALDSICTHHTIKYRRQFFDLLMENDKLAKEFKRFTTALPYEIPRVERFMSYENLIRKVRKMVRFPNALRRLSEHSFHAKIWWELQEYAEEFLETGSNFIEITDSVKPMNVNRVNAVEITEKLKPYSKKVIESVKELRNQTRTYRAFEGIFKNTIKRDRAVCKPELEFDDKPSLEMKEMYHPSVYYLGNDAPRGCTPNDYFIDTENPMMILTGPNSGGKTGFRFAAQLNTLLVSNGFWAFAESVKGVPYRRQWSLGELTGDIGKEGTFGSILDYGAEVRDNVTQDDIVFFDELDRGTYPADQQWFARGLLTSFLKHKIPTVAITHDLDLVNMLKDHEGIQFYRVADYEGGEERFKIYPGISDSGYGKQKAREKKMDPESLEAILDERFNEK